MGKFLAIFSCTKNTKTWEAEVEISVPRRLQAPPENSARSLNGKIEGCPNARYLRLVEGPRKDPSLPFFWSAGIECNFSGLPTVTQYTSMQCTPGVTTIKTQLRLVINNRVKDRDVCSLVATLPGWTIVARTGNVYQLAYIGEGEINFSKVIAKMAANARVVKSVSRIFVVSDV